MRIEIDKFYYKPLPNCTTIKESKIEGLGIFATEDIEARYDFGAGWIKVPMIIGFIRTPVGGFINHAKQPNCIITELINWDDYKVYNLISLRKIKKGQELTVYY